jgi:hypothetical protein
MAVFHEGSKKVAMRCFARAAVAAAFLCATGAAHAMDMPANCQQQMQQCSLKVWGHNSFARAGETQSVTFSNGAVLTCTSTGANKPRNCKFDPPPDDALRHQCADLKQQLSALMDVQDDAQNSVDHMRNYFAQLMQMTPDMLDQQMQALRSQQASHARQRPLMPIGLPTGSASDTRYNAWVAQNITLNKEMDFLRDLETSKAAGPNLGASTEKMQDKATKIVNEQQTWATEVTQLDHKEIQELSDQIAKLNCVNVPVPAFDKPVGTQ